MASYDTAERRLRLEIGVVGCNDEIRDAFLGRVAQSFRTRWRAGAELRIGGERHPFEWLQVEAGLVDGIPVRARTFAISEDSPSLRRYLLRRCDALVFTCRGHLGNLRTVRRSFERVRADARGAGSPPMVVVLVTDAFDPVGSFWDEQWSTNPALPIMLIGFDDTPPAGYRDAMRTAIARGIEYAPEIAVAAAHRDFGRADGDTDA